MAHPGYPIELDPTWAHAGNVLAAIVADSGTTARDLANDVAATLGDWAIANDPTYGDVLRCQAGAAVDLAIPDPGLGGATAFTVLVWTMQADGDSGDIVDQAGTGGDVFRLNRAGNDLFWAYAGPDTGEVYDGASVTDWTALNLLGVSWSTASQTVTAHANNDHGAGGATAGATALIATTQNMLVRAMSLGSTCLCVLVLDAELSGAEVDSIYASDPFAPFRQQSAAAPQLSGVSVASDGASLQVQLSKDVVVGAGGTGGFALAGANAPAVTAAVDGVDASIINLTPARKLLSGETFTLSYTQPGDGFEDSSGQDLATFSGAGVANNSAVLAGLLTEELRQPNADSVVAASASVRVLVWFGSTITGAPDAELAAQSITAGVLKADLTGNGILLGDSLSALLLWDAGGESRSLAVEGVTAAEVQ